MNEETKTIVLADAVDQANEPGEVYWDLSHRCVSVYTGLGDTLHLGHSLQGVGVNKTGGASSFGKVVYLSGTQGNRPTFDYADASDGAKVVTVGIVTTENGDNEEDSVLTFGEVSGFNTSAWVAGTHLYIAADGTGTLTSTAPSRPNYRILMGTVIVQHAVQGAIFVHPGIDYSDGVTLHELDILTQVTISENLVLPKVPGYGIKVEPDSPTFGFRDLLGEIKILSPGANDPTLAVFRDSIRAFSFSNAVMNEANFHFHIPHDYAPSSDIFIHAHWSQNVIDTGGPAGVPGDVKWQFEVTYAKAHNQAAFSASFTTSVVGTASTTQYQHLLHEVQLSAASPSATQIDSDIIEPDGLIIVRAFRNPVDAADTLNQVPFLHYVDIHYQSTNIATKAKAPDFWT